MRNNYNPIIPPYHPVGWVLAQRNQAEIKEIVDSIPETPLLRAYLNMRRMSMSNKIREQLIRSEFEEARLRRVF